MSIESNRIYQNYQQLVYQHYHPKELAKKNAINHLFDRISLSFKAIQVGIKLFQFHSKLPNKIKYKDSDLNIRIIKNTANLFFNPKGALNIKNQDIYRIAIQCEAQEIILKHLGQDTFKEFNPVKNILKGKNTPIMQGFKKDIKDQLKNELADWKLNYPVSSPNLNDFETMIDHIINQTLISQLEKVAEETYLIDPDSLKDLKAERQITQISQEISHLEALFVKPFPTVKCPINLIDKQTLMDIKKKHTALAKALEKKGANDRLNTVKAELNSIEAVLTDWDNRSEIKDEIVISYGKTNLLRLPSYLREALKNHQLELKQQLRTSHNSQVKKELVKQLRQANEILSLSNPDNANQLIADCNKANYKEFIKIDLFHLNLKNLKRIPLTSQNQEFLKKAWVHVLTITAVKARNAPTPEEKAIAKAQYQQALSFVEYTAKSDKELEATTFNKVLAKHKQLNISVVSKKEVDKPDSGLAKTSLIDLQTPQTTYVNLTAHEIKMIRSLDNILRYSRINPEKLTRFSEEDKAEINRFIFNALGNSDLNKRLFDFSKRNVAFGISLSTVEMLLTFTHKSNGHKQFTRLAEKAGRLTERLDNQEPIKDKDKLSLKEFGLLKQAADLADIFESFDQATLLREGTYVNLLKEKTAKAKEQLEILNEHFQADVQANDSYKSGDIAAWHSLKWQEFLVKKPTSEVNLMRKWVTEIGHGSYIYRAKEDEDGLSKTMQSHIYGDYENESFDVQQAAFSEVWRLQVPRLTKRKSPLYQLLAKIYQAEGKNVEEEMQKTFEEAAREIHEDLQENFKLMENDQDRRFDAGKADYGLAGGHKRTSSRSDNFMHIHEEFKEGPKNPKEKKKIICSEFVTKATIAALIETDKQLIAKIRDYAKERSDDPVISAMVDNLLQAHETKGMHVLELPYDDRERLKRVHTGRMIDLLVQKNCVVKVNPPAILAQIFTDETFHSNLKTKSLIQRETNAKDLMARGEVKKSLDIYEKLATDGAPASYHQEALASFGLEVGEWSQIRKQKVNIRDPFFNSKIAFTPLEISALKIFNEMDASRKIQKLSPEKAKIIKQFFAHIYQNDDFNQRINQFARTQHREDLNQKIFNSNTLSYLREFSFKSHQFQQLEYLTPRFNHVGNLVEKHEEHLIVSEDDKLTLNDYRMVDTFGNMKPMLGWANRLGLCEEGSLFKKLKDQVQQITEGMEKINQRFLNEVQIESGDILLDVLDKANRYEAKAFDITDKVDWLLKLQEGLFGHHFQHAALGFKRDGQIQMAEIDLTYQSSNVDLGRLCIVDAFRLDFAKMMTPRALNFLRKVERAKGTSNSGDIDKAVQKHLNKKFRAIMEDFLNDETVFQNIQNSAFRQVTTILKSTKKNKSEDLGELDFQKAQEMICSEFVARAIGHCLHKMELELGQELAQFYQDNKRINPKVAKNLFSKTHLMDNPMRIHQNFEAIHGDRLFDIFKEYLQPVEMPAFLKHIQVQAESRT